MTRITARRTAWQLVSVPVLVFWVTTALWYGAGPTLALGAIAPQPAVGAALAARTPTVTRTPTPKITIAPARTTIPRAAPARSTPTSTRTGVSRIANTPTRTATRPVALATPTRTAARPAAAATATRTHTSVPNIVSTPTRTATRPVALATPTRTATRPAALVTSTPTTALWVASTPTRTVIAPPTASLRTVTPTALPAAPTVRRAAPLVAAATTSTTFVPVADSYVDSSATTTNRGTATQLRVDASPIVNSYLRFSVTGLTGPVSSATLRVFATSSQATGYTANAVADNTWGETTITYANAPAIGASVGASGAVAANTWTAVDVTSYITGNGTVSFALKTTNSTALAMASRETGANAPQLVIAAATGATSTPTPTSTPTTVMLPTNTPTPTSTPTTAGPPTPTSTPTTGTAPTNTPTPTSTTVPGTLCLLVYNDLNGDGIRQNGEPLLTGAQLAVMDSGNAVVATWTTNGTEPVCFNLPPANYTVAETNPSGFVSTTPDTAMATVSSGSSLEIDFGDQQAPPTPTNTPANTATSTPTSTPAGIPPTLTPTATGTPTSTSTPTPTRTATPLPTLANDPVIAVAGDIACDPTNANFAGGNKNACQQRATAQLITAMKPAGVLILGDNQYYCGGLSAFQQSYDLSWGAFKSITHPSAGNHEYLTSGGTGCDATNTGAAGYFNYFGAAAGVQGKGYYSFDVGSWHLIALNSNCGNVGGCSSNSPQGTWLRADLAAHTNMCTLAFWHIPVWSSGGRAASNMATPTSLLYNANADLILDAHDHLYERFAPQNPSSVLDLARGIRSFVVGTGGANHTSVATIMPNSEVRNDTTFGVLKLTLHPGSFDWQFVPVAGSTFTDSGTQICH